MRPSVLALILIACAPSVPDELPPTSPASESARAAPLPSVGIALRQDPPLPGEDTSAWPGLGAAGDHGMHDHGMTMHEMGDAGMMMMMDGGMMHHGH